MTRFALPFALAALTLAALALDPEDAPPASEADLVLVPFAVDAVRVPVPVEAKLLVANAHAEPGAAREVRVERVRLRAGDLELDARAIGTRIAPDADYLAAQALVERLPRELTERRDPRRRFARGDAPPVPNAEVGEAMTRLRAHLDAVRAREARGGTPAFVEPSLALPLDLLFAGDEPAGTRVTLTFEVDYRVADGSLQRASATHELEWKGAGPRLPAHLAATGMTLHSGDLHVHSCHGEAAGACAPSGNCAAESLQTSGSFTYAQLKAQYQALGLDWFTATDHSYCIGSDAEYDAIVAEIAAITDPVFVALPDIEVSSDEQGPQTGSDLGDILCLFTQQNHMGAHGISSRIPGGSDGFLGFCGGLDPFPSTVAAVRAQGGLPIAHHPTAGSFAWNSFANATGIEAGALHGVEIWNGPFVSGQGGDVGRWVDWLLAGRVLYAYSGSDTHDAAFAFGANHAVFFRETFDAAGLLEVLREGRVFVSNGPVLLIEVEVDGGTFFMGERPELPLQGLPSASLVRVHYDFGSDTGSVAVLEGRVGDAGETLLVQVDGLTGAGMFEFPSSLSGPERSWVRAYAENQSASEVAYSNPVFFERVNALTSDTPALSLSGGGTQALALNAGPGRGGDFYWVFGSATGTMPGLVIGVPVPLNFDAYFQLTLNKPFLAIFTDFLGTLAADGTALAGFDLPAGSDPSLAGITLHHAATVAETFGIVDFASNAVPLLLAP